ncbi:Putative F-box protein At1g50870 [Linum grandiflorum]
MNKATIAELKRVHWERISEWIDSSGESNNEDDDEEQIQSKTPTSIDNSSISSIYGHEDVVVSQILTRLPVKSLMKFKCVSKGWKSTIEKDSHFIDLHRRRSESSPPGILIVVAPLNRRKASYDLSFLSADFDYSLRRRSRNQLNDQSVKRIQSSVWLKWLGPVRGGLLCLAKEFAVQIFNVGTGEVTPWIQVHSESRKIASKFSPEYFFGIDPGSGKHKVLCCWFRCDRNLTERCEILTVGEEEEKSRFRRIDIVPPFNGIVRFINAYANGSIYWFDTLGEAESLIAFDFASEKFRRIPIPAFTRFEAEEEDTTGSKEMAFRRRYEAVDKTRYYRRTPKCSSYEQLMEMDGCLTLVRRVYRTVKMWKFHDYDKKENGSSDKDWIQVVDIRLPVEMTSDVYIYFHPIPGRRQLILETYVSSPVIEMEHWSDVNFKRNVKFARFYWYDPTEKSFSRLRMDGVSSIPEDCLTTFSLVVESLLPVVRW